MKPKFSQSNDTFVIENYHASRPFSSFLPGIAGEHGKPMWVFYTNRGQCISSFGIRNKGGGMLEFYPANKAYAVTPLGGFRTFLKVAGTSGRYWEPFKTVPEPGVRQILRIRSGEIEIEEIHPGWGLSVQVSYYTAPQENQPLLIRQVRLKNLKGRSMRLDVMDGLPQVVPYGLNEWLLKQMSRTMEAFAEVLHASDRLPFFKLKVEPSDRPEMERIEAGFFSFTVVNDACARVIVDPQSVFGADTSLQVPLQWLDSRGSASGVEQPESTTACAFASFKASLPARGTIAWDSYFGQAPTWDEAERLRRRVLSTANYAEGKRTENSALLNRLTDQFALHCGDPRLDPYSRQAFLDNTLRGGQPWVVGDGDRPRVFHYYTRKHGDMERDYNFFELAPTYFSQGNGNFRDVNQNRRNETFLFPGVGGANVETFFNLIQLDGFNPLVIQYETFVLGSTALEDALALLPQAERDSWRGFLSRPFNPGTLYEKLLASLRDDRVVASRLFDQILAGAEKHQDASHGEGFWVDHWIYNLDLLEQFAAVYPDRLQRVMTGIKEFTYFDSDHVVQPRHKKTILRDDGKVRQMKAVAKDAEKAARLRVRKSDPYKVRTQFGEGEIFRTTLLAKLLGLIAIKASSLDPSGVGLEMEADKPGWCDAMNGLPALFASSVNEAFALRRAVRFVDSRLDELLGNGDGVSLAVEVADLLRDVQETLAAPAGPSFFRTWDTLAGHREQFRDRTRLGVSGQEAVWAKPAIRGFLDVVSRTLERGLKKAVGKSGLITTYFINEITEFEKLPPVPSSADHPEEKPLQAVRALEFRAQPVAPFLEGPMNALRGAVDVAAARSVYRSVKKSNLFDRKLGMYRLNLPLSGESFEIGRAKIFTPGWLENESIFLHMHYKFLLETLRSGLVHEFFADFRQGLVAFQDPAIYGRSIFENSSFIASSAFPDPRLHGNGFVSRLTGATAEWISMVLQMGLGSRPFQWSHGELRFAPKPTLARWMFAAKEAGSFEKNTFGFKLFGRTWIVYHNPSRRDVGDSRGPAPARFQAVYPDGRTVAREGTYLPDEQSRDLRQGKLARIDIELR